MKIPLKPFTLVGATTRAGLLTAPLRGRFGIVHRLDFYTEADLHRIVTRSARILGRAHRRRRRRRDRRAAAAARRASPTACCAACATSPRSGPTAPSPPRSPGTPSPSSRWTPTASTRWTAASSSRSSRSSAAGRSGVNALAAAISEEPDAIEDIYEPYLLQHGFLDRTPRGRTATRRAYEHLGLPVPDARPGEPPEEAVLTADARCRRPSLTYDDSAPTTSSCRPSSSPRSRSPSATPRGCSCSTARPARSQHRAFADLPELLRPGDLLVTNRSRVFPARLLGRRPGGGEAEILLVRRREPDALGRAGPPGPAPAAGRRRRHRARLPRARRGPRRARRPATARRRCAASASSSTARTPTPRSSATATCPCRPTSAGPTAPADRERYQTVFAREAGSVAAPTAGLHFTPALLDRLRERGIERAELVLHVGPGTFRPVEVEDVREHRVDPERFTIPAETAAAVDRARAEGRRVVAVGTTATRALESALGPDGPPPARGGRDRTSSSCPASASAPWTPSSRTSTCPARRSSSW